MATLFGLLGTARDGMTAQQTALSVASQNIGGSSSPDYVKRRVRLETSSALQGSGVKVAGIDRMTDAFAAARVVDQEGRLAAAQTREGVLSTVQVMASPIGDNIADRVGTLLGSFVDVAGNPSDLGAREAVLANAESVARRFNEIASSLAGTRQELYLQAGSQVNEVDQRIDRLADLNLRVIEAVGRGEDAATLRDQRDQLVREIGQRIDVHASEGPDGNLTLFGAGTTLVDRDQHAHLAVQLDPTGALAFSVDRGGTTTRVGGVDSGSLGGIARVRDQDLKSLGDDLDSLAFDFANKVNAIHAGGVGLDGASGRSLFSGFSGVAGAASTITLDPSLVGHPDRLAAAGSLAEIPGGNSVARQLADVGNATLAGGGTVSDRAAGFSERIGFLKADATSEAQLREDTVSTAHSLRESVSGVSTDEELADMQQFQRAYEASLRVMRTADDLLQELLKL